MRLALIGPRGAGKSTVAGILSRQTGYPLVSTDRAAEERMGMSIDEMVRSRGWSAFRGLEMRVLADVAAMHPIDLVLDCGGGIVLAQENRRLLGSFDHIVYLTADPETLVGRLRRDAVSRPPLTTEEDPLQEMRGILKRRDPIYRAMSHSVFNTAARSPWEIAEKILSNLGIKALQGAQ